MLRVRNRSIDLSIDFSFNAYIVLESCELKY